MTTKDTPTPTAPGAAMTEERLAEKLDGLVREASQTKLVACHAKSNKYITTIEGHGGGIAYTCCGDADQQNADADLIEALWNNSQAIIAALRELTRLRSQAREVERVGAELAVLRVVVGDAQMSDTPTDSAVTAEALEPKRLAAIRDFAARDAYYNNDLAVELLSHIAAITAERDRLKVERDEATRHVDYWSDMACALRESLNAAEARAAELVAALRDLHDDIQGRQDDGANFNPGTLIALARAAAALTPPQREASSK